MPHVCHDSQFSVILIANTTYYRAFFLEIMVILFTAESCLPVDRLYSPNSQSVEHCRWSVSSVHTLSEHGFTHWMNGDGRPSDVDYAWIPRAASVSQTQQPNGHATE